VSKIAKIFADFKNREKCCNKYKIHPKMFLKKEENIAFSISIVVWQSFGYFGGILWQLIQQFQNQHKIQPFYTTIFS
jgi:hypothetical protein